MNNIKPTKILGEEQINENDLYLYKNEFASYHLKFIPQPDLWPKCSILCHDVEFESELSKIIDTWEDPGKMKSLDLIACVYYSLESAMKTYYLNCYKIFVELVPDDNTIPSNDIMVPTFETKTVKTKVVNEPERRIKSYKSFSR